LATEFPTLVREIIISPLWHRGSHVFLLEPFQVAFPVLPEQKWIGHLGG
jgi:hypothetical protein